MDEIHMCGAMGLCVRAGQAVFGTEGCISEIRSGNCGLLLVSRSASSGAKDKFAQACGASNVPLVEIPEDLIAEATGRPGIAMAVRKGGFCDKLEAIAEDKPVVKSKKTNKNKGNKFGGVNV